MVLVDFGNVLYNIHFQRTVDALAALPGYNGASIRFGVDDQDEVFVAVDKGELSIPDFRTALRERFGFTCSDADLDAAWCAILIGPFHHAPQVINDLRKRYPKDRLVLISNISELHLAYVSDQFQQGAEGSWDLAPGATFDALYFSCRMGKRKPDAEAFLHVCSAENVEPTECILFDDSQANCVAARGLGMRTVRVMPGDPHLAFREPEAA